MADYRKIDGSEKWNFLGPFFGKKCFSLHNSSLNNLKWFTNSNLIFFQVNLPTPAKNCFKISKAWIFILIINIQLWSFIHNLWKNQPKWMHRVYFAFLSHQVGDKPLWWMVLVYWLCIITFKVLIFARIYFRDLDDIREIRDKKFSQNFQNLHFREIRENLFPWNTGQYSGQRSCFFPHPHSSRQFQNAVFFPSFSRGRA